MKERKKKQEAEWDLAPQGGRGKRGEAPETGEAPSLAGISAGTEKEFQGLREHSNQSVAGSRVRPPQVVHATTCAPQPEMCLQTQTGWMLECWVWREQTRGKPEGMGGWSSTTRNIYGRSLGRHRSKVPLFRGL